MPAESHQLAALIRQIRRCHRHLSAITEHIHDDSGLTASQRSVIETLSIRGAQTVPRIAKALGVSRQHVQVTMDSLLTTEMVRKRANPAHKRSSLYELTARGREIFARIRAKEADILDALSGTAEPAELGAARQTLKALDKRLTAMLDR